MARTEVAAMKKMNCRMMSFLLAVAAAFAQPQPARVSAPASWVVYGLDVSGSFRLTADAFAQAAKEVERHAQPGDVWFFRLINDRSYADDASILALRCPAPVADSANPFDRTARQRKQAADLELARLRAATAQFLLRYQVKAAPRTDVYGFLAKSGELLAAAPQGTRKILVIASDLVHTAGQAPVIDLSDVRVIVGLFQGSGQGKTTQALRRSWQTKFQKFGAIEVRFVDASQAMIEELVNR